MNNDLQETIRNAVAESVATAMKSAISEFTEVFNGLPTHMDDRFDDVNRRLDAHDARFDRLEARVENLEDSTREGFDRVNITLDGIVGQLDDDEVERAALTAQMNRHEDWIVEPAPLVRVDYTPGS